MEILTPFQQQLLEAVGATQLSHLLQLFGLRRVIPIGAPGPGTDSGNRVRDGGRGAAWGNPHTGGTPPAAFFLRYRLSDHLNFLSSAGVNENLRAIAILDALHLVQVAIVSGRQIPNF